MASTNIHSVHTTLARSLAYISNSVKTENGSLVETFGCSKDPDIAEKEFLQMADLKGSGRNKVLAQHIVQSFKIGEISPEKALEVGGELCDRLLGGQYQYMLAVHTDKKHIHCHIVFNNVSMENGRTFSYQNDRGKHKSWEKVRSLSDEICKENGLSVIENPEKSKGKSHYEWDMNRLGLSWKSKLKNCIDECIMHSENFDDFLKKCGDFGIDYSYDPQHKIDLKFMLDEQKLSNPNAKFTRAKTLGWYYETEQIKRRIEQFKLIKTGRSEHTKPKITDTSEEKFAENFGLRNWAEIKNMQEVSKMINILTEQNISSTQELESVSISDYGQRMKLVTDLNDIQHKIDDVFDIIRDVRTYKKYKSVMEEYRSLSKFRQGGFEKKYRTELSKFSDSKGRLKERFGTAKIPSEETLKSQRNELIEQRDSLNERYKNLRKKIKDLDTARATLEQYKAKEIEKNTRKKDELE